MILHVFAFSPERISVSAHHFAFVVFLITAWKMRASALKNNWWITTTLTERNRTSTLKLQGNVSQCCEHVNLWTWMPSKPPNDWIRNTVRCAVEFVWIWSRWSRLSKKLFFIIWGHQRKSRLTASENVKTPLIWWMWYHCYYYYSVIVKPTRCWWKYFLQYSYVVRLCIQFF